jgi:hypothetical protein
MSVSIQKWHVAIILSCLLQLAVSACDDGDKSGEKVPGPGTTSPSKADDYLSAELRDEVEKLKKANAERSDKPMSRDTFNSYAPVFWKWINAYALAGGVLETDTPGLVNNSSMGSGANKEGNLKYKGDTSMVWMDRIIRELSFREENPKAIGTLNADLGPFVAGTFNSFTQTYTVGSASIKPGGGIVVGHHYMSDNSDLQATDPAGDNYIVVVSSNKQAKFTAEKAPPLGTINTRGALYFRLEGATLNEGDTITVTYGDKSGGSQGFLIHTYAIDRYPLPLYVKLDGESDLFFFLPLQNIEVSGRSAAGVHGFAPSIVGVNEAVTISVRSEDEYYNRASGDIPGYKVLLNGAPYKTIAAGQNPITLLENVSFSKPGVYRFTFESEDGSIKGVANPILVKENPQMRIYWGEEHGHSGMAEGMGLVVGYFKFAYEDARLDFAAHTDHDVSMDDGEWEEIRKNVKDFHKEGEFITYLAYEWSARVELGGHHNVFFRTPDNRQRVPLQTHARLSDLYQTLREQNDDKDVLVVPHYHQGDWRYSDPKVQSLVEIMSAHTTSEWFAQKFLENGHQIGFAAGSDDHFNHPGYSSPWHRPHGMLQQGGLTAVMAPQKGTDAIFDAMKDRFTYATTQERIILDVTTNDSRMGTRIQFTPDRKIEGSVVGTGELDRIDILKNSKVVHSFDLASAENSNSNRFQVIFYSPNHPPYNLQLLNRNPRLWRGTLEVKGGIIESVKSLGFDNPRVHKLYRDENNPNLYHFVALTTGMTNGLDITVGGGAGAKIVVALEAAKEFKLMGSQQAEDAPSFEHPAATLEATLNNLPKEGKVFELIPPDTEANQEKPRIVAAGPSDSQVLVPGTPYTDTVTIRRIKTDIPMETNFTFSEEDNIGVGDYYYVRVRQLDGAMAWSSPVWIGGFPVP